MNIVNLSGYIFFSSQNVLIYAMMKQLLFLAVQAIIVQYCAAQQDSLAFAHAKWEVKKLFSVLY